MAGEHGRQLGAWVSIRCTWALGRGMREGAWWTAEQGQPCCGCKASDVHQAWGTWGMRVQQAELGLVLRARGMRADSHDARKSNDVLSEWGTWVMHGREAEMGLEQGARGMRAQDTCTRFALWARGTRAQGHMLWTSMGRAGGTHRARGLGHGWLHPGTWALGKDHP